MNITFVVILMLTFTKLILERYKACQKTDFKNNILLTGFITNYI